VSIQTALRVLVVEDCPEQARALANLLHFHGYDVVVAHNGFTGLAAALSERPDVLLCDLEMPLLDGIGVIRHVWAIDAGYRPLLVAVTGADRQSCLQAGFHDHLAKPVDANRLLSLLQSTGRVSSE
jgi:CheY-like chemotaxis protein